jgi:RNA-directed DNA polymerase
VTTKLLNYLLYVLPPKEKYRTFNISKKILGIRKITAPSYRINGIQRKLKLVLDIVYKPKPATHGFVLERSIITNARLHKKRRYVLNIDLENFFPTIHFGRVRGLFMGNPYKLNNEVATILAQLCCHEGVLPQGAPTSPIISNMICARLDAKLQQLAKKHQCTYSRYADDITFSTNRSKFPSAFAHLSDIGQVDIGNELSSMIQENGFRVNSRKTRLQLKQQRQEVTGLTVNRYPNVQRRFIKQVRGMLHAWDKYGLDSTAKRYYEKYAGIKYVDPKEYRPPFEKVVWGKIQFIGMVKGKNSPIYQDLVWRYLNVGSGLTKKANANEAPTIEVLVYAEGKTDGKHFSAALTSFQREKRFRHVSLTNLDNQGFDNLDKRLDFTVATPEKNTKPHIFIFDRDIKMDLYNKVGGDVQYKSWGNGVYSMVLPLPRHREQTPKISVEFYYKDNDIVRKDKNGRRIFLSTEFDKTTGQHLTEELNCILIKKLGDPLKVIDEKVFNRQRQNVALSKDEFAENILAQTEEFSDIDFSGFVPLLEMISTIVADFNGEIGDSA